MQPSFKTQTGHYTDNQDGTFTFVNSGYETTFTIPDLQKMIIDQTPVFEYGELAAIQEDGLDPAEILADGGGYRFDDNDGMIHGRDIMHAIDEELLEFLANEDY
jgi:hypothetical protein